MNRMMKRRGYILVFVLGVTTVVTALGLSYISANGTVMTQATNRYAAVRAQYIAESGAALAAHYVQYPPTSVPVNGLFAGATGVAIDDTMDTVDITLTASSPANRYLISASATVRDSLGTTALAKQRIRSEVIIPPEPKWKIMQAVLANGTISVPSGVSIVGNLHANGSVTGPLLGGSCNGAVTATGTALWLAGGSPSPVLSLQPSVSSPTANTALYTNYNIRGNAYSSYTGYTKNDMDKNDSSSLSSSVNSSGTNPGRIVYLAAGDFGLRDDVAFTGALVVRGNLEVNGKSIVLQAVADYPALIVTGDILFKVDSKSMTVYGPVVCGGSINDNGKKNCVLTINGAAVLRNGFTSTGSSNLITVTWNSSRCSFWDLALTPNPPPVTVLEWQEN